MPGTLHYVNRALSEPILVLGAERSLVIIAGLFWGWALLGVFPHWPAALMLLGCALTLYALRFIAKADPKGVAVFRANSRFLLQGRYYTARGQAAVLVKARKLATVPTSWLTRA